MERTAITEAPCWTDQLATFNGTSITDESGWSLGCDASEVDLFPGAKVEYWGKGLGYPVRGLAVAGHVFWYRTPEEEEAHQQRQRQEADEERRAEFESNRERHDRNYESLPDTFKARIDRFRNGNPDFRWEYEQYEVGVCLDAVKLASWCSVNRVATEFDGDEPTAADNVLAFEKLSWDDQKAAGIDGGHSGNSFAFVVRLAYLWVTDPGLVEFEHGALTPLVGCEDYGCTHGEATDA